MILSFSVLLFPVLDGLADGIEISFMSMICFLFSVLLALFYDGHIDRGFSLYSYQEDTKPHTVKNLLKSNTLSQVEQ